MRSSKQTHGLEERGAAADGVWRPRAGVGHVQKKCRGQYTHAIAYGCTVYTLLFETLGGFSPDVCQLLKELAEVRDNRLSKAEYDDTTWAARSWGGVGGAAAQRRAACRLAAAEEMAHALGIATA